MAEIQEIPARFLVKDAAAILGLTAGGLRGAILRGKLPAFKAEDGRLYIDRVQVAAYHLYGCSLPEESLTDSRSTALTDYLRTVLS